MADKFLNLTGLGYYHNRIKNLFALQSGLDALEDRVDEIVAEGGEPNVIEVVKKNGTALTPDAQKAVDITVPTTTSELTNNGDGQSNFATEAYVDTNGGKIDKIKVNGIEQAITNKEVDIEVPTLLVGDGLSKVSNQSDNSFEFSAIQAGLEYTSKINNVTDTNVILASKDYVDANGGKIDKIKVNGTEQTIVDKAVDITVPTEVSDLTNDSGYQTASDVQGAIGTALANGNNPYQTEEDVALSISSAVASAYKYRGSVATYNDLPASGQAVGDVWDVQDTGVNYAWTGNEWDDLGPYVDTSVLWTSTTGQTNTLEAMTTAEIDAILNA